jgi:hypothetical protein
MSSRCYHRTSAHLSTGHQWSNQFLNSWINLNLTLTWQAALSSNGPTFVAVFLPSVPSSASPTNNALSALPQLPSSSRRRQGIAFTW